ncbi:MAG: hypothetical protein ACOC4E_02990 [Patescibacteria group bacterium]
MKDTVEEIASWVPDVIHFKYEAGQDSNLAALAYDILTNGYADNHDRYAYNSATGVLSAEDEDGVLRQVRLVAGPEVPPDAHNGRTVVIREATHHDKVSGRYRITDYDVRLAPERAHRARGTGMRLPYGHADQAHALENRLRSMLNQVLADYLVKADARVRLGMHPWGNKPGMRGIPAAGDRERVLTAFGGTRILGPTLQGSGPLRIHIPMCPNRNDRATAIATTLSHKKVRALQDYLRSAARLLNEVEVHFYVFNGDTVQDPLYERVNFPGLWGQARLSEWCQAAYQETERVLVGPLRRQIHGAVTITPMHEAFGDISVQPAPEATLIEAAHAAYDKFAAEQWSNGEMAEVTRCDFRLNQAIFAQLGASDVVLSSKFHRQIFELAYAAPLRDINPDVGLLLLSRNTLFKMSVDHN